ncbi:MAG TPA: hypothetical protein VFE41_12985 [Acetobacteraceae bacterium]|nr:hypothetical protein [Acetobacteraceae bacterium]
MGRVFRPLRDCDQVFFFLTWLHLQRCRRHRRHPGPIIIGFLLRGGDFTLSLTFISCIAFAEVLSYIFVLGKLERVRE